MGFEWNKTTGQMTLTRGDSGKRFRCAVTFDGEVYEMQEGDKLQFGVKADYDDKACLIKKTWNENPFTFGFVPQDTKRLDYGTYYYDFQIVLANGWTYTFYEKKKLKLTEEVV